MITLRKVLYIATLLKYDIIRKQNNLGVYMEKKDCKILIIDDETELSKV